jgi:hypothetical protein
MGFGAPNSRDRWIRDMLLSYYMMAWRQMWDYHNRQTALSNYRQWRIINWPIASHSPSLYSSYGANAVDINTFCYLIPSTSCIAVCPDLTDKFYKLHFLLFSPPSFFLRKWKRFITPWSLNFSVLWVIMQRRLVKHWQPIAPIFTGPVSKCLGHLTDRLSRNVGA